MQNEPNCVTSPNIHAQNASMVAGSAFAIAYKSDINDVGLEDMVVFSVNQHAPWITVDYEYEVPDLPACPDGGCICAWSWIPNGCGEANMFLNAYRCKVTGATSQRTLAKPQAPVYCESDDDDQAGLRFGSRPTASTWTTASRPAAGGRPLRTKSADSRAWVS